MIALLDEDALAPSSRNKADLLSADQAVLGGGKGTGPAFSHGSDPLRFPLAPLQNPCSTASRSDNSNPRPESKPSDLSLPARTRMTWSCPSTACWTSPAPARSPPVFTRLPSGPSLLWNPPLLCRSWAEWTLTQRLGGKGPSKEA